MRFRGFVFLCGAMIWGVGAYAAAPQSPPRGLISASPVYPGRTIPSAAAAGRSRAAVAERCTIPAGATVCNALVTWSTANVNSAVVTVQDTLGGGQVPFANGLAGSQAAQIQPFPHRYLFRLYDSSSGNLILLADTTVLASGTGTIYGFPNPCTILSGQSSCKSTISWTTQTVTTAQVTKQDIGGGELAFGTGTSGNQEATISTQTTFRLYDTSSGEANKVLLAATTVTAIGNTISASPNPCTLLSGRSSCISTISWSTLGVTVAEVTRQRDDEVNETVIPGGLSGIQDFEILAFHQYTFRLYDTSSPNKVLLAATTVRAVGSTLIFDGAPNPCEIVIGQTTCSSRISWATQGVTRVVITVQTATVGENLTNPFVDTRRDGSSATVGFKDYTQIEAAPQQYTFRLYDASNASNPNQFIWLAGMVVVAKGMGAITANPNPCTIPSDPPSATTCTSNIIWSTSQAVTKAQVTKRDMGPNPPPPEEQFATGASTPTVPVRTQSDPNIAAPPAHLYDFRLYDFSCSDPPTSTSCNAVPNQWAPFGYWLAETRVLAMGTGVISADPNPCEITNGGSCTTNIEWNTNNAAAAEIKWIECGVTCPDPDPDLENDCAVGTSSAPLPGGTLSSGDCLVDLLLLAPPHRYVLRLYDFSSGIDFWLAQVEVSAILPAAPLAPSGLTATAVSSTEINLAWTDNSTNEEGFKIQRSQKADFSSIETTVTVPADTETYSDKNLTPSTTYYYRVWAFNSAGDSGYSTASATTPAAAPPPPSAPSNLTATAVSNSQINLAWTDTSSNEDGFKIERSTNGTTFTEIAQVAANATTYSNTGLTASTTYWYQVRAFNSGGNSAYSNIATAPPSSPTNLKAVASLSGKKAVVNLTWEYSGSKVDIFLIERCQGLGCNNFNGIAQVAGTERHYTDTMVSRRKFYSYRMRAQNPGGISAYSNAVRDVKTP